MMYLHKLYIHNMYFTLFFFTLHVYYMYLHLFYILISYMSYMTITCHVNCIVMVWNLMLCLVFVVHSQSDQCSGENLAFKTIHLDACCLSSCVWTRIYMRCSKGAIPRRWGALCWWWNAITACLRDGMSRQPTHTLRDGQTNQKWRLKLFE